MYSSLIGSEASHEKINYVCLKCTYIEAAHKLRLHTKLRPRANEADTVLTSNDVPMRPHGN